MLKTSLALILFLSLSAVHAQDPDCVECKIEKNAEFLDPTFKSIMKDPLIKIEKPVLTKNKKAEYCKRDVNMIDTIVFHHTASPTTHTTKQINDYHKTEGTSSDPWLMIGYHYTITAPYPGEAKPIAKVEQGRPLEIIGSHTGSLTFSSPSTEAMKVIKEKPPQCGKEGKKFVTDKKLYGPDGRPRANVSTVGVVIIGNYEPYSKKNPGGYPIGKPRYPTEDALVQAAKLSCQLQMENPNIKFIKWHNFYKATGCPGTVEEKISRIIELAKGYGCEFSS